MRPHQITELFDTRKKWGWKKDPHGFQWIAQFEVGGIPYHVSFSGFNAISITFAAITRNEHGSGPHQGITGTGSAPTVFATVLDIIRDFVKERQPRSFGFEAKKNQPSRIRLYRKMIQAIGDVPGYQFEEDDADNPHHDAVSFYFKKV